MLANETAGLPDVNTLSLLAGCRYLLKLALNGRLAVAEHVVGEAHARRDVVEPFTPSVSGNTIGAELYGDVPRMPFSPPGNQLHACS